MLEQLIINSNIRGSLLLGLDFHRFKFGVSARISANAERDVTDKTNEANLQIWREQREYDYQKWQEENEYNTPANQVKRYQDAGINPNLAMSNISSGSATSSAGGQTAPTMAKPDMASAINADNTRVNNQVQNMALIGQQLSDISKQYEETKAIQMQNNWFNVEKALDVGRKTRDNKLVDEALESARRANRFGRETYQSDVDKNNFTSLLVERQYLNSVCQGSIMEIEKDMANYTKEHLLPQQYQMNVRAMETSYIQAVAAWKNANANELNAKTNANESKSRIEVNKATALKAYADFLNGMEDNETKKFWNSVNEATKEHIGRKIIADANKSSADASKATVDAFFAPFDHVFDYGRKAYPYIMR